MNNTRRKRGADLSALSEFQIDQRIRQVRTLMRTTDLQIENLNKRSRRTGKKISGMSGDQFKALRGTLKRSRQKLERELQELQEAKSSIK